MLKPSEFGWLAAVDLRCACIHGILYSLSGEIAKKAEFLYTVFNLHCL